MHSNTRQRLDMNPW